MYIYNNLHINVTGKGERRMEIEKLHVLNQGIRTIHVRRRKVGTSYVLTVPTAVETLVKVAPKYQLSILEDGSLYYEPIYKEQPAKD